MNFLVLKLKRTILQSILFLFVFFLLILGVEGLLRLQKKADVSENIYSRDATGLRVLQPNLNTVIVGGQNMPIRIHSNAEGYATPAIPVQAETSTKRIAFLGNSFTLGFEVDNDKRFTDLIQEGLNKPQKYGKYEVMNYAQGGYTVPEQLMVYRDYVRKYHPDTVVLVLYLGYDIPSMNNFFEKREYLLNTELKDLKRKDFFSDPAPSIKTNISLREKAIEHSEVLKKSIRLIRENETLNSVAISLGIFHKPLTSQVGNYQNEIYAYLNQEDIEKNKTTEFLSEVIKRLGKEIKKDGGNLTVLIIPSPWQIDNRMKDQLAETGIQYDFFLPNRILAKNFEGILSYHDLSEVLEKNLNERNVEIFIKNVGHFTTRAHEIVAEDFLSYLKSDFKKYE